MARIPHPIDELSALSRSFGPAAARRKAELLDDIACRHSLSARRTIRLHDTLYFMRAYPDNEDVLQKVRSGIDAMRERAEALTGGDPSNPALADHGIPGGSNTYEYSYGVLQRLVRRFPGCFEIDWSGVDDESALGNALLLTVGASEVRGIEDEYLSMREWIADNRSKPSQSDLEVVLRLFHRSGLTPYQQEFAFENCNLPIVYQLRKAGSGRCEATAEFAPVAFQKRPLVKERFPLRPRILEPLTDRQLLPRREGRRMLDIALASLCSYNLEIHPLIYANPADVTVIGCGRGLQVVLAGVVPEFRPAFESNLFFMILKNGVPLAYGPACIFLGCCEMGINLFAEFRGGEIRYIYSQFMRALYHAAHVRYFYLVSYGMGEGNPEALETGAFWFYRKLGFRATEPDVEALARHEEAIMRRRPGYRSSMNTLRELSYTEAYFDMSGGVCRPVDVASIARAITRDVTSHFGGNRRRAALAYARSLVQDIGNDDYDRWTRPEKSAMVQLAPVFTCLPGGIASWSQRDRQALADILKAKGGPSELSYIECATHLPRLANDLRVFSPDPA